MKSTTASLVADINNYAKLVILTQENHTELFSAYKSIHDIYQESRPSNIVELELFWHVLTK